MHFLQRNYDKQKIDRTFDNKKINVILMHFFDAISIEGKLTQLERAFEKPKIMVLLMSLFDKFFGMLKMKAV